MIYLEIFIASIKVKQKRDKYLAKRFSYRINRYICDLSLCKYNVNVYSVEYLYYTDVLYENEFFINVICL